VPVTGWSASRQTSPFGGAAAATLVAVLLLPEAPPHVGYWWAATRSGWWIVSKEVLLYASASPSGCGEFGSKASRPRYPAVPSGVRGSVVPVGDQPERVRGAIGLIVFRFPDDRGRVETRLLGHPAVVRPSGDQGAAGFAGHTRAAAGQGPTADQNEVVDDPGTAYIAGRQYEGVDDLVEAVRRPVDRIGAGIEERRVHMVAVQKRPVRLRGQLHQPDRDAQCVSAPRTPEALHCGSVTFRPGDSIRNMRGGRSSITPSQEGRSSQRALTDGSGLTRLAAGCVVLKDFPASPPLGRW
jgi:hypothetical protein